MSVSDYFPKIATWLRCPICHADLKLVEKILSCATGHSFDQAKQGYINLLGRHSGQNADTPQMIAARERFLSNGYYQPISNLINQKLAKTPRIIEVGAGSGHYLAKVLETNSSALGLATDISTAAARRAAKKHPRMAAIVADTWEQLPIKTAKLDAVLCVFAPKNPKEFFRILTDHGLVLFITPGQNHLIEIRRKYDLLGVAEDKSSNLGKAMSRFSPISIQHLEYHIKLNPTDINDLIQMGPNAHHQPPLADSSAEVTIQVDVSTFRKL